MGNENKKVMIIDDEESIRLSLVSFFEDLDYEVYAAENAEEGLKIIEGENIAAAIVDIRLPEMDGFDFVRYAAKINNSAYFIFYTGSVEAKIPSDLMEMEKVWNTMYIKPVYDMTCFLDIIESL